MTETPRGLNPKVPQEAAKSTVSAQVSDVEELALLVQPLQTIPLLMSLRALKLTLLSLPRKGMSPKVPRLILLGLPRKGTSPKVPRLILLSLPKKWPKQS